MKSDKLNVPVKFDLEKIEELPIKITAQEKKKRKAAINEALVFAKYGLPIMRIKAATLAALGRDIENAGVKAIGHGKVMVASENAEQAIAVIAAQIDELQKSDKPTKHDLIVTMLKLLREFNGQLLNTAQAHFNAEKQLLVQNNTANLTMPFPAGQPLFIAPINNPTP